MAVCSDHFRMRCERSPPSFLAEVGQLNQRFRISTLQHIANHEAMIPYNPYRSKPQTRAKRKRSWSPPARDSFLRRCQFPGPNTHSYMRLCAILYQHACALIRITPSGQGIVGWKVGFLIHKSLFLFFDDRLQTESVRYLQSCLFPAMEIERRWERKREASADAENHLFYASLCVTDKAHRKVMLINRSRDEQSYRPLSSEIDKKEKNGRAKRGRGRMKWGKKVKMSCSWIEVLQSLWIYQFMMLSLFAHPRVVLNADDFLFSVQTSAALFNTIPDI